jgi:hypothetical protein
MKTIIDAVNELRADINNVAYIKSDETYHCNLNYNDYSGWWCGRGVYGDFVCTIDDFKVITLEMTFHSRTAYDYINADKELLQSVKPELIFTQEMCDNGDFPAIGMECAFETTFFTHLPSNTGTGKPIAYHNNKVWFSTSSKEFVINLSVIYFKPLTPLIELIDGKVYQFEVKLNVYVGFYRKDRNSFMCSSACGPKLCGLSEATNIQLLTLENK